MTALGRGEARVWYRRSSLLSYCRLYGRQMYPYITVACITIVVTLFELSVYNRMYNCYSNDLTLDYPRLNCCALNSPNGKPPAFDQPAPKTTAQDIIPNLVHYVQFTNGNVSWLMYLSILSALRIGQVEQIFVHTDVKLFGPYWDKIRTDHRIQVKHLEPKRMISGKKVQYIEHSSDYARYQVVQAHGGVYLDNDCLVIAPFHELRRVHECVVAMSPLETWLGSQVIMGTKDCPYVQEMLHQYDTYYLPGDWYYNAGHVPVQEVLMKKHHIAYKYAYGIEFAVKDYLFGGIYLTVAELAQRYPIVHTYYRGKAIEYKDYRDYTRFVNTLNTTFGNVARYILHGSEALTCA